MRSASQLAERADDFGFNLNPAKPVEDETAADELARLSAIIEAATERGEAAPVLVIVAVQNIIAGMR